MATASVTKFAVHGTWHLMPEDVGAVLKVLYEHEADVIDVAPAPTTALNGNKSPKGAKPAHQPMPPPVKPKARSSNIPGKVLALLAEHSPQSHGTIAQYLGSVGASPKSTSATLHRCMVKGFVERTADNTYQITAAGRAQLMAPPPASRRRHGRVPAREVMEDFARQKWPENFTTGEAVRHGAPHGHSVSSTYQALSVNLRDDILARVAPGIYRLSDRLAAALENPAAVEPHSTESTKGQPA